MKIIFFLLVIFLCFNFTHSKAQQHKHTKTLHPLSNTAFEVKKDEIFYYEAEVHTSVGIQVEYEVEDTQIIAFHHSEIRYKNKQNVEKGADEAIKILAFEAKSVGETTITFKELFRGEIKNTYTFKITVTQ
jgi:hypothetical protein